jgi:predicted SAM-dependent methyltransferase
MLRLNLGACDAHLDTAEGWINVDRVQPADQIADLSHDWPWEDSTVDEIRSYDIFEHLKRKTFTMNEAHRVLKPNGRLDLFVPTTDGRGAFQDPTHVSYWNCNSLLYYCEQFAEWQRFHESYGITANFRIVAMFPRMTWPIQDEHWNGNMDILKESPVHIWFPDHVSKLKVILEAIK